MGKNGRDAENIEKQGKNPNVYGENKMERAMGFEPTTATLARWAE